MKEVGVIKELDKLGRLVIPKEYRSRFGLSGEVELVLTREGILLRSPEYRLVGINDNTSHEGTPDEAE